MPRRARSGVAVRVISLPSKLILPAEARHRPMMVRRQVVLPAPLRPSSMVSECCGTEKFTPCRMWYWPMWVFTPASCRRSGTRYPAEPSGRDTKIGFLHDRRGDDFGRLAIGDELALMQHDDAVGERPDHVHLMFD